MGPAFPRAHCRNCKSHRYSGEPMRDTQHDSTPFHIPDVKRLVVLRQDALKRESAGFLWTNAPGEKSSEAA